MHEQLSLNEAELRGAWKMLCVHVLKQTVAKIVESRNVWICTKRSRELGVPVSQLPVSLEEVWMQREDAGVITFQDVCETIGVPCRKARLLIERYADARSRKRPNQSQYKLPPEVL